jgi:outer membrane protein assembly factor BamD (BamD/ComL family)
MSISAIAGSIFSQLESLSGPSKRQQIQQGFQQLGQDLQSGNLSQAQNDFATLQQYFPGAQQATAAASTTNTQNANPLTAAIAQLSQDLQSGNITAAQSDLATVQQDAQQLGQQQGTGQTHHHHHHGSGAGSDQGSAQQSGISTLFSELGTALQSGNLNAAQQAYSTLQQDFQQFALNNSATSSSTSSGAANANFNVSV